MALSDGRGGSMVIKDLKTYMKCYSENGDVLHRCNVCWYTTRSQANYIHHNIPNYRMPRVSAESLEFVVFKYSFFS